jgi:hypothetical protein
MPGLEAVPVRVDADGMVVSELAAPSETRGDDPGASLPDQSGGHDDRAPRALIAWARRGR